MAARTGGRRGWERAAIAVVASALLLGACGGGLGDSASPQFSSVGGSISSAGGGVPSRDRDASSGDASSEATAASGGGGSDAPVSPIALPSTAGRDLVVTGAVTIEVDDVAEAQARAAAAVTGVGGFVADEQSSFAGEPRATITYRVPAEGYAATLRSFAALGTVEEQTRSTEDVTDRLVDLDSRIRTSRTSVERLRTFLSEATDLTQVASLEAELLRRETELETLTASQRAVEDRVALATLVATFHEPQPQEAVAAAEPKDTELPTFLDGLDAGWTGLVRGLQVGGAAVGLALPFVPLLVAGALLVRFGRWIAGRRGPGTTPGPAPTPA